MNKSVLTLVVLLSTTFVYQACQKEEPLSSGYSSVEYSNTPQLPSNPYNYNARFNDNWVTLGRVLFYDKALSYNNATSCASCHHQSMAFADNGKGSSGFIGLKTERNSPPIFNMTSNTDFFWDMRRTSLNEMVLDPITHTVEMGFNGIDPLIKKLEGIEYYNDLLKKVNGSFNQQTIATALEAFVGSIESRTSRFDLSASQLTAEEQLGHSIFISSGCNNCHGGNNFNNTAIFTQYYGSGGSGNGRSDLANIGLEMNYKDKGIAEDILLNHPNPLGETAKGEGHFKIPSLRNIALTAPYMHDGRFQTLEEVVNHYSEKVVNHPGLDPRLMEKSVDQFGNVINVGPKRLHLKEDEKKALVSFLKTLTDENLTTDQRFSDPFLVRK